MVLQKKPVAEDTELQSLFDMTKESKAGIGIVAVLAWVLICGFIFFLLWLLLF